MSFLNELKFLFFERKDIEFSDNVNRVTQKIFDFLFKKRNKIYSISEYERGKGFYIRYDLIDPKSTYSDLYISLFNKNESADIDSVFVNPASLFIYKDAKTNSKYYVLRLYIFDDEEDMRKNVSSRIKEIFNSPKWRSSVFHELTHYFDNKRRLIDDYKRDFYNYITDKEFEDILERIKKYHNLTDEINAHFIQSATQFWNAVKKKKINLKEISFEDFKEAFIYFYDKKAFENLEENNRKRILKRIYLLYIELKNLKE